MARLLREAGVQGIDLEELERDFRLYLKPRFGESPLAEIRREDVRIFLAEFRERRLTKKGREEQKLALGTIKNTLSALRGCLNQAVEDGHLPANPAARLGKLLRAREEIRKQADPLSADELSSELATCREWSIKRGTADSRRWFFPFILTLARTGLRLGEAIALQW